LASWLNIKSFDSVAPDGVIKDYNYNQKLLDRRGLSGVVAGDFYTAPREWYNDFWGSSIYGRRVDRPNLNSDDYYNSDWLTQKIWRQSAILTPIVTTKRGLDAAKVGTWGSVSYLTGTGFKTVAEGENFDISWVDYMGREAESGAKVEKFSVRQLSYQSLGLDQNTPREIGNTSKTIFSRPGGRSKVQFDGVDKQVSGNPLTRLLPAGSASGFAPNETYTVQPLEGLQGDRFFKVELLNSSNTPIGTPVYFMVTDS
jgi:hypothetical protein